VWLLCFPAPAVVPTAGTFACAAGSTLLQMSVRTGEDKIETAGRIITTSVCKRVMEIVVERIRAFYGAVFIELVITDDCASGESTITSPCVKATVCVREALLDDFLLRRVRCRRSVWCVCAAVHTSHCQQPTEWSLRLSSRGHSDR
jgi:hypothetical protein